MSHRHQKLSLFNAELIIFSPKPVLRMAFPTVVNGTTSTRHSNQKPGSQCRRPHPPLLHTQSQTKTLQCSP